MGSQLVPECPPPGLYLHPWVGAGEGGGRGGQGESIDGIILKPALPTSTVLALGHLCQLGVASSVSTIYLQYLVCLVWNREDKNSYFHKLMFLHKIIIILVRNALGQHVLLNI